MHSSRTLHGDRIENKQIQLQIVMKIRRMRHLNLKLMEERNSFVKINRWIFCIKLNIEIQRLTQRSVRCSSLNLPNFLVSSLIFRCNVQNNTISCSRQYVSLWLIEKIYRVEIHKRTHRSKSNVLWNRSMVFLLKMFQHRERNTIVQWTTMEWRLHSTDNESIHFDKIFFVHRLKFHWDDDNKNHQLDRDHRFHQSKDVRRRKFVNSFLFWFYNIHWFELNNRQNVLTLRNISAMMEEKCRRNFLNRPMDHFDTLLDIRSKNKLERDQRWTHTKHVAITKSIKLTYEIFF